ncbi:MAG: DUF6320 domain-containing protein, partial [Anaerovoracaceae bacterium]
FEYFGYLMATALISLCPVILYLLKFSNQLWTSVLAGFTCIIIALGMIVFAPHSLKKELKKRLHF